MIQPVQFSTDGLTRLLPLLHRRSVLGMEDPGDKLPEAEADVIRQAEEEDMEVEGDDVEGEEGVAQAEVTEEELGDQGGYEADGENDQDDEGSAELQEDQEITARLDLKQGDDNEGGERGGNDNAEEIEENDNEGEEERKKDDNQGGIEGNDNEREEEMKKDDNVDGIEGNDNEREEEMKKDDNVDEIEEEDDGGNQQNVDLHDDGDSDTVTEGDGEEEEEEEEDEVEELDKTMEEEEDKDDKNEAMGDEEEQDDDEEEEEEEEEDDDDDSEREPDEVVEGILRSAMAELLAALAEREAALQRAAARLDDQLEDIQSMTKAGLKQINRQFNNMREAIRLRRRALAMKVHSKRDEKTAVLHYGKACLVLSKSCLLSRRRAARLAAGEITPAQFRADSVLDLDLSVSMPRHVVPTTSRITSVVNQEVVTRTERRVFQLGTAASQERVFRFHDNHGDSVVLLNDKRTARRNATTFYGGIVVAADPMEICRLYEVVLDAADADASGGGGGGGGEGGGRGGGGGGRGGAVCDKRMLTVGVVTASPDTLTIPQDASRWRRKFALIVYASLVDDHGNKTVSEVGRGLGRLRSGSRVGVLFDRGDKLRLFLDGEDQGAVPCRGLPDPSYVMFELLGENAQISTLPISRPAAFQPPVVVMAAAESSSDEDSSSEDSTTDEESP